MKWKGMVSQPGMAKMATRLIAEKTAHPASSHQGRNGQLSLTAKRPSPNRRPARLASVAGKLVALTAHRLDQAEAQLGSQPPHAHVDDVGARVEIVAPDPGQQLPLRHGLAGMFGQ